MGAIKNSAEYSKAVRQNADGKCAYIFIRRIVFKFEILSSYSAYKADIVQVRFNPLVASKSPIDE